MGSESKIRMQDLRVKISGRRIENSDKRVQK
jgi:hypothetical protein